MKLLKYFILVFSVTFILITITSLFLNKGLVNSTIDFYGKMNAARVNAVSPELHIVGSSRALTHINPFILDSIGYTTYNYGLNAATIYTCYNMVAYILDNHKNTKGIILNVDYFMFDKGSDPYKDPYYYPYLQNNVGSKYNEIGRGLYPGFIDVSFYDDYVKYAAINGWLRPITKNPDATRGYVPSKLSPYSQTDSLLERKQIVKYDENGFLLLEEIIRICKSKGVMIFLLEAPYYKAASPKIFVSNYDLVKTRVTNIAEKHGIPFWDFSEMDITAEVKYFTNFSHLNSKGADIYSNGILDSLRSVIHP